MKEYTHTHTYTHSLSLTHAHKTFLCVYIWASIHLSNCISRRGDLTIGRSMHDGDAIFSPLSSFSTERWRERFLLCILLTDGRESTVHHTHKINIAERLPQENDPHYVFSCSIARSLFPSSGLFPLRDRATIPADLDRATSTSNARTLSLPTMNVCAHARLEKKQARFTFFLSSRCLVIVLSVSFTKITEPFV